MNKSPLVSLVVPVYTVEPYTTVPLLFVWKAKAGLHKVAILLRRK